MGKRFVGFLLSVLSPALAGSCVVCGQKKATPRLEGGLSFYAREGLGIVHIKHG
ncbi:hypothetical protein FACS1894110_05580 [Spirochaetia bacterium]|nr:hypothetical protein FACS1894110_05580 [Spirochaetia bacterium]